MPVPTPNTEATPSDAATPHLERDETSRFAPDAGEANATETGAPPSWHAPGPYSPMPAAPPEFHSPNPNVPPIAAPPQKQWWEPPAKRMTGVFFVGLVAAVIVAAAAFWYPLWTGQNISHSFWQLHMWLPSWI